MKEYTCLALLCGLLLLAGSTTAQAQATSRIPFQKGGDIWIINDDSTGLNNLSAVEFDPLGEFSEGQPSACGNRIVFASDKEDLGGADIWIINRNGTGAVNLTPGTEGTETKPHCGMLSLGGNGLVVFVSTMATDDGSETELYTVPTSGFLNIVRLTNNTVKDDDPTWCGGSKIAFIRKMGTGTSPSADEVLIMNQDGSEPYRLTCDEWHTAAPSCYRKQDGSLHVAFAAGDNFVEGLDDPQPADIYRIAVCDACPGHEQIGGCEVPYCCFDQVSGRLTTNVLAEDTAPSWSPGGDFITFASDRVGPLDGNVDYEIYKIDAVDGEEVFLQQLTVNHPEDDEEPYWSEMRP